jgi:3-methylcrotonyl-CoA carboxylase alpha subunit
MEMNTRLQVEHPVTEMITGVDLVEWQLRVAAGEPLPLAQGDLAITGHAIEVRLYAENPVRGFLPATGVLNRLRFPEPGPHVRIDTGVVEGDEVTPYYDPMIAKIVVWDENRSRALRRLRGVLAGAEIAGVTTNIAFLGRIAANPEFAAGHIDTGFIERHMAELVPESGEVSDRMLALAALAVLLRRAEEADLAAWTSADHTSPWHHMDGWRLNDEGHDEIKFLLAEREFQVGVHYRKGGYLFDLAGGRIAAEGEFDEDDRMIASLDGARSKVTILQDGGRVTVMDGGDTCELEVFDPLSAAKTVESGDSGLVAPLPGKVIAVMTEEGAEVAKGDALMIVEAMKMEHTITAPSAGRISALGYGEGDTVDEGAILLDFVSTETPDD